jgi:hypothetical protein
MSWWGRECGWGRERKREEREGVGGVGGVEGERMEGVEGERMEGSYRQCMVI